MCLCLFCSFMIWGKGIRVGGQVRKYTCFTGSPNQNCRKHFGFVILRWHKITVGQMLPAGQFGQNNLCSPTQKQAAHTAHLQGLRGSQCQGLQPLCLSYRLSTDGGSQTAPPDQNPLCSLLSGGDCPSAWGTALVHFLLPTKHSCSSAYLVWELEEDQPCLE